MKKGRIRKKTLVVLTIIAVLVSIIIVGAYQSQPQPKKPAAEYFEIFEATVNDAEFRDPPEDQGGSYQTSSILIIYGISFKLRAKLGDAHNVVIESWTSRVPNRYYEIILKGQYGYYDESSPSPFGYFSRKEEGKFPFKVRIRSSEAEGTITIYL